MIVPGSNLLNMALSIIGSDTILFSKFLGRELNAAGKYINVYAPQVPLEGSWQPMDQRAYQTYGLDLQKQYFMFYTSEVVESIARGSAPDLVERNGRKYETKGDTPWFSVDGWTAAMFVDVGPAE